jgi:hypothetical protein
MTTACLAIMAVYCVGVLPRDARRSRIVAAPVSPRLLQVTVMSRKAPAQWRWGCG